MLIPPIFFNLYSPLHFVIWYVSRWWINSPKGDRPEVKARLNQVVSEKLDQDRLRELLEERVLARDSMDFSKVQKIREDIERAEARRLQPHFIAAFFLEAFQRLGGTVRQREPKRYEITNVPTLLRNRDRSLGMGEPILKRYERICFNKELINVPGKPVATFVCPSHSLLDATIDLNVCQPFQREPDFGASSVNYDWKELWGRGEEPQRHKIM